MTTPDLEVLRRARDYMIRRGGSTITRADVHAAERDLGRRLEVHR